MRNLMVALGMMLAATGASAEQPCFSVNVGSIPQPVLLGLPLEINAEVCNVCGHALRAAIPNPGLLFPMILESTDPEGQSGRSCNYCKAHFRVGEKELSPGWKVVNRVVYLPRKPGRYAFRLVFLPEGYAHFYHGEHLGELYWQGARSEEFHVAVAMPQGVDLEAHQLYGGNPLCLWTHTCGPERPGEILRRFPASSYAAYVIWDHQAHGILRGNTDGFMHTMSAGLARESNSVPCDREVCGPNGWMSLSGRDLVEWRCRWFELVLEHHPELWFADEVRFKLALDRYLLGDPNATAAQLGALAASAQPDVAQKARDLLQALRSKGLLAPGDAR